MDNSEVDNLQPVTREHLDFKLVRDDFNEHDVARSLKTINGLEEEMTKNDNVYTHRKIDQCELRPIKGGLSESDRAGVSLKLPGNEDINSNHDDKKNGGDDCTKPTDDHSDQRDNTIGSSRYGCNDDGDSDGDSDSHGNDYHKGDDVDDNDGENMEGGSEVIIEDNCDGDDDVCDQTSDLCDVDKTGGCYDRRYSIASYTDENQFPQQVMNQNIAEDENKGRDYSAIDNRHPCKDKSGSSDHKSSPSFAKETEHVRIRSGSQVNECREYLELRIISSLSKPENDLQDKKLDRNGCEECSDLQGTCAHALCATASSESISREENVEEAFVPHSDVVRKALAFSMAPKVVEVESSKNFQGKVDQALRYKLDMHDFKRSSKRVHKDFYVIFPGRVIDIPHTCFLHYEDYRDAVIHNYAVKHADIHSVLTTDTFDYFMEALIKRRVIKGTRGLRNRYNSVKEVRGTRSRFAHREQEKHVQRPKRTVGCMCRRSRRPKKRTRAAAGEELGLVTRRRGMLGLMLAPILRAIRKRF